MSWLKFLLVLGAFLPVSVFCQTLPAEGDTLNYRMVGFSFPDVVVKKEVKLEIAAGLFQDDALFKKHIVKAISSKSNKIITDVPSFGAVYTWRVTDPTVKGKSLYHHFYTGSLPTVDTGNTRLTITHAAEKYQDAHVFLDASRVLYDMKGNALWYLPDLEGLIRDNSQLRDMKLTNRHTITFVVDGKAVEVDYNGNILWRGPHGRLARRDTLEGYHHEITRLSNGNYMALAFEPMARPKPVPRDSDRHKMDSMRQRNRALRKPRYGEVVEYDASGNRVWMWKAADYFAQAGVEFYKKANGMPEFDVHMNSFYFDEKNRFVYVSFRNISQVLKVSYPSGEVVKAYGKIENETDSMEKHLFCGQHACKIGSDGSLFLYNNGCTAISEPSVVKLHEPLNEKDSLKRTWEVTLPVQLRRADLMTTNGNPNAPIHRYYFTSGGNVEELPDHSLLVSTNAPYCDVMIISPEKKVLWSGAAERWREDKKAWIPLMLYRSSIITDPKDLESLIWSAAPKK